MNTLDTVTLVMMLVAVILPVQAAYRGKGYRGLYLGVALVCLVLTYGCFSLTPSARDFARVVAAKDETQLAGTKAMMTIAPAFGLTWMAATFGSVLATVLFRSKGSGVTSRATLRKCPHCAEFVQPEAIVCKHCRHELPPAIVEKYKATFR